MGPQLQGFSSFRENVYQRNGTHYFRIYIPTDHFFTVAANVCLKPETQTLRR